MPADEVHSLDLGVSSTTVNDNRFSAYQLYQSALSVPTKAAHSRATRELHQATPIGTRVVKDGSSVIAVSHFDTAYQSAEPDAGEFARCTIAVAPEFRGRGIATQLFQSMMDVIRDTKAEYVLATLGEEQEDAHAFLDAMGFLPGRNAFEQKDVYIDKADMTGGSTNAGDHTFVERQYVLQDKRHEDAKADCRRGSLKRGLVGRVYGTMLNWLPLEY